jgi:hypothetical protein
MSRRILIGILIVSLLAPGVAVPHSHAGIDVPADHNERPHFHFRQFWLYVFLFEDDDHEHDAACGDSHEHEGDDSHLHASNDDASTAPRPHDPVSDESHDADALYVSGLVVQTPPTQWSDNGVTLSAGLLPHLQVFDGPHVPRIPTPESLPPPIGRYACPIYLQTRTLLI